MSAAGSKARLQARGPAGPGRCRSNQVQVSLPKLEVLEDLRGPANLPHVVRPHRRKGPWR